MGAGRHLVKSFESKIILIMEYSTELDACVHLITGE